MAKSQRRIEERISEKEDAHGHQRKRKLTHWMKMGRVFL